MQRKSMLNATLIMLLLLFPVPLLFALNPCSTCFSTYIGLVEYNGTINASVFYINQTTVLTQDIGYFDREIRYFFTGEPILSNSTGLPGNNSPVDIDMNFTPLDNAEVFFYYYNRTGGKVEVPNCVPVITNNVGIGPNGATFYYASCTIPYALYANSAITIYVEYKGNQTLKPSEREITIYDTTAGGINVLSQALRNTIDPSSPVCLAGLVMLGLLLSSMYFSGRNPLAFMDINVPRVPKPKAYSFGSLVAGEGNIRIAVLSNLNQKRMDKIINRHASIDFRKLNPNVAREIEKSKASAIQKYFAKLKASQRGNWREILEKDELDLISEARKNVGKEGGLQPQLLQIMEQRVTSGKLSKGLGTISGSRPKWLTFPLKYVQKVPLIGTFIGVASGSLFYGGRTTLLMAKSGASPIVRHVLKKTGRYEKEGETSPEKPAKGLFSKTFYNIAAMTDSKKMNVGKIFQMDEYVTRFYEDARDAVYEDIVKYLIWREIINQLRSNEKEKASKLIESLLQFKNLFKGKDVHEFIEALKKINFDKEYIDILKDANLSSRDRANEIIKIIDKKKETDANLKEVQKTLDKLNDIQQKQSTNFEKAQQLVEFLRNEHEIHKPKDLSDAIKNGNFFITVGRNGLIYEQNGVTRNFGFITLALNEFTNQLIFRSVVKDAKTNKPLDQNSEYGDFTIMDAFKLAWLKMCSQVFGHRGWFNNLEEDIVFYDPALGKKRKGSFVKDILGMDKDDLNELTKKMTSYLEDLMTGEGKEKLKNAKGKTVDDFLYGYNILKVKEKEEKDWRFWKRQQWYFMESESYPDQQYWRANMNFMWSSIPQADQKITLLYEVRGQKYWANMPRPEPAWYLIESFMDTRLAHILNGSQFDFYGYNEPTQLKRLSRVDMYKFFNETWEFYSKLNDALSKLYTHLNKDNKNPTIADVQNYFKENPNVTYDMLRNSEIPLIYTHDMSYIPYVKGLAVADFDRIVNGVFVVSDNNGKRLFNFSKIGEYEQELAKDQDLQSILRNLGNLKKAPSLQDINAFSKLLKDNSISSDLSEKFNNLLKILEAFANTHSNNVNEYTSQLKNAITAATELRNLINSSSLEQDLKYKLLRAMDRIDPNMQSLRTLTPEEIKHITNLLQKSNLSAEAKVAFMYRFSHITHDWESLWTNDKFDFFELMSEKKAREEVSLAPPRGIIGNLFKWIVGEEKYAALWEKAARKAWGATQAITGFIEPMMWAAGRVESEAMANNVAVSELYRERGADLRMRIKAGTFLDGLPEFYTDEDKRLLMRDYHNYADSFQRFFVGWMDSVTRDPRGSSTQWGMQWYLQTMYHRGGAMHPEAHDFGGERTFLSPLGWFFGQTYIRSLSLNWMFGSPFVRMMRGFQTAAYGYPTIWDKNITPTGDFDLMNPWQRVPYTNYQKYRALLNPAESVFTLKNFDVATIISRALHVTPGLNLFLYLLPQIERWSGLKFGNTPLYSLLSSVPGFRSILEQSHAQRSQRTGMDIVNALKQTLEDFLQYKGGAFVHHFTDTANPGLSYVDYTGRGRLASRIASYLTRDLTGATPEDSEKWRKFYGEDEYVKRQATFSMARRRIGAAVKRLHFQEEMTGYGPTQNPMWAATNVLFASYWLGKWAINSPMASALTAATLYAGGGPLFWAFGAIQFGKQFGYGVGYNKFWRSYQERKRMREAGIEPESILHSVRNSVVNFAKQQYTNFGIDTHVCMYCGRGRVRRGGKCSSCGLYFG